MKKEPMFQFFNRLWADAQTSEFLWTVLLAAAFVIIALIMRRAIRQKLKKEARENGFGAGAFIRLLPPLTALLLTFVTREILLYLSWEHLSFLKIQSILLFTWLLIRFFVYVIHCVFPNNPLFNRYEKRLTFFLWALPLAEVSGILDLVIDAFKHLEVNIGKQTINLWMLIHSVFTICITLLFALWIASVLERRFMKAVSLDRSLKEVFSRLLKAFVITIALLTSLSLVGIDITTLSVFSGALAVGLGFGLQKIASNYVSGFIILLDRSIKIGNLIALDDKTSGTITKITTRYTVLKMLNGIEVIIPNEYLVSNMVRNLSFSDSKLALTISLQVAYDTDFEKMMPMMTAVAQENPRVLKDPAPIVLITAFADSGVNLDVNIWLSDPELGTGKVRSDLSLALLHLFNQEGVSIPYPQREIRILEKKADGL